MPQEDRPTTAGMCSVSGSPNSLLIFLVLMLLQFNENVIILFWTKTAKKSKHF